jgi:hypothetical protein
MLPEGASAQDPAQHPRSRSRRRSFTCRDRSFRALPARSKACRDAVRAPQTNPEARSPPLAWPKWRARRVHPRSHRPEFTPARQAGRPTPTSGHRVRESCISVVSVSAIASKSPLNWSADNTPLQESAQQLDRFLQQNLPQPDITPVLRTAGISNLRRLRPSGAGFLDLTRFKEAGTARFAKPFSATIRH